MLCTDQDTWASFSLTKLVILLLSSCICKDCQHCHCICKTGFQTKKGGDWILQSATFFILSLRAASSSLWTDWITGSSPSPVNLEFVNLSKPVNTYQRPFCCKRTGLTSQALSLGEQPRPLEPAARLWRPEYI